MSAIHRKLLFISTFVLLFQYCQPPQKTISETPKDDLIGTTWTLSGITFYEKDQFIEPPKDGRTPTLTFLAAGQLSIKNSTNTCTASYTRNEAAFSVTLGGCTKICCDTSFDKDVLAVLASAKKISVGDQKYMRIEGEDRILRLEKTSSE